MAQVLYVPEDQKIIQFLVRTWWRNSHSELLHVEQRERMIVKSCSKAYIWGLCDQGCQYSLFEVYFASESFTKKNCDYFGILFVGLNMCHLLMNSMKTGQQLLKSRCNSVFSMDFTFILKLCISGAVNYDFLKFFWVLIAKIVNFLLWNNCIRKRFGNIYG